MALITVIPTCRCRRDRPSRTAVHIAISDNYSGAFYIHSSVGANITNCTISDNRDYPAVVSFRGHVYITNNIIWANEGGDIGTDCWSKHAGHVTASFSILQYDWKDVSPCVTVNNCIVADPCFADPCSGDLHLKSQAGRWDPNSESWVQDVVTSPAIDAGDPASPIGLEPFPNGGIINMGAYGGTEEASKSYFGTVPCETIVAGDINGDCRVNFLDFQLMALHWLRDESP